MGQATAIGGGITVRIHRNNQLMARSGQVGLSVFKIKDPERMSHIGTDSWKIVWCANDEITMVKACELLRDMLADRYPHLADLLEAEGEDTQACLNFPPQHRWRIRTTNDLERFNQEIKRRTRIVHVFPNHNAALRLIGALCMEQAEEWLTGSSTWICRYWRGEITNRKQI